jgi:hypothetical protein
MAQLDSRVSLGLSTRLYFQACLTTVDLLGQEARTWRITCFLVACRGPSGSIRATLIDFWSSLSV